MKTPFSTFRTWLGSNEPFLRLVEIIVVIFAGIWISYQQTLIARRSLEVSEAELQQVKLQTDLAKHQYAPDFRFIHEVDQTSSIGATDKTERIRSLDGTAKLCIEVRGAEGAVRRILIEGFYDPLHSGPKDIGETIRFYYPEALYQAAAFSFQLSNPFEARDKQSVQFGDVDFQNVRSCSYVTLSFFDAANQRQTQHYRLGFPCDASSPLDSEPSFERTVSLKDFYGPTKKETAALVSHVRELIADLRRR